MTKEKYTLTQERLKELLHYDTVTGIALGAFEEAVAARKAAEKKYGFHPNHGKKRVAQTSSV